jgi:hypothetical protein
LPYRTADNKIDGAVITIVALPGGALSSSTDR